MRLSPFIFALLFLFLLPSACTIRKRIHNGGYYIEWHKQHRETHEKKEAVALPEAPEDTLTEVAQDTVPESETIGVRDTIAQDSVAERSDTDKQRRKKDKRFEPLGVRAAELLIAPVLIGLLDDATNDPRQHFTLSLLFVVALSLCFILGIVSMVRYLRDPGAYRFNIWAILAILIPLFYAVLAIKGMSALF